MKSSRNSKGRNSKGTWKLNDTFGKTKPSSFPQRSKVVGRVYSSTKLIANALNHSFETSSQTNVTPTGPSKTTNTNIKKNISYHAKEILPFCHQPLLKKYLH